MYDRTMQPSDSILFSGGAPGAEAEFGACAERHGIEEVNFTFDGHKIDRHRGVRVLNHEELQAGDVSLEYVSRLMHRRYTDSPTIRKVLQTLWYQVNHGQEIYVIGTILEDGTVRGGTGWGAEFAKLCNKPLHVFDQDKDGWFQLERHRLDGARPVEAADDHASALHGNRDPNHPRQRPACDRGALDPIVWSLTVSTADVVIVGAGAAGMATAIFIRRANPARSVLLLDGARKPGAKILVSGGARCNVTNRVVSDRDFWGGRRTLIRRVLRAFTADDTVRFFRDAGRPGARRGRRQAVSRQQPLA